ncbi:MAG: peptide deformylase [bacterium]|jgi:peptide deformylase|nr:peptide deformylase [Bacillota bacterium]
MGEGELNIRLYGDPVLRQPAQSVTKINDRLRRLLHDMAVSMYDADGVGLAAPQVGVLLRAVVIDVGEGLLTLINPEIIAAEGEELGVEGCLSLPGLVGDVPRSSKVTVRALDLKGRNQEISGENLLARALQHELDHLDGILFIDRAQNIRPSESEEDRG